MSISIGFIGCGKIAQSLIKGFITSGIARADNILASAPQEDVTCHRDTKSLGCETTFDNNEVANNSEVIILAVKPPTVATVLNEIKTSISSKQLLISIALGIPISLIEATLHQNSRVIRVMSNTPVLVKKGATVFSCGTNALKSDSILVKKLFTSVGMCDEVPESLINAVTALSGSGPAYVHMIMEALADAGVMQGIPHELSLKLVAHTFIGSATMALDTGKHPASLKNDVCSPAGCTIQAVYHLERSGLRAILMEAVSIATDVAKTKSESNK